ncbi:MAG: tetratricopeptide repeat protein [Candidatus Cloacimonetes bacterium]|nr:tetratricopeptide repeat protein [Candidatus Cloacimonadota bacterium]
MDNIEKILWKAQFQQKKNWLQVRRFLQEALARYPQEKRLYHALADLYFSQQLYARAINVYMDLLDLDDSDDQVNFKIGNCFLSLKEYRLAIDYYEKVKTDFPELTYNKAFAYSKIGKFEESLKIMQEIMSYQIYTELPLIFITELYFALKDYNKAIEYLNKAEVMFGKQGTFHYLRGLAYSHMEKWLQAYLEFQKADKFKLDSYHFYRAYGIACDKIGKTDQAVDHLLKSIKLFPGNSASYLDLIRIYLDNNRIMEAYTLIMHAKKNIPFSISLSLLYNQIMQRMKKGIKKDLYEDL